MHRENAIEFLTFLVGSIISVATVAVIFSRQGQTANVITAFGSSLANVLNVVVQPVMGGNSTG